MLYLRSDRDDIVRLIMKIWNFYSCTLFLAFCIGSYVSLITCIIQENFINLVPFDIVTA